MLEVKLGTVLVVASIGGQALTGTPFLEVLPQTPAYGLLIWYLWQDGKRRTEATKCQQETEAKRDERYLSQINSMEDRREKTISTIGERCHEHQKQLTGQVVEAINKNTLVLHEVVAANAKHDEVMHQVKSTLKGN